MKQGRVDCIKNKKYPAPKSLPISTASNQTGNYWNTKCQFMNPQCDMNINTKSHAWRNNKYRLRDCLLVTGTLQVKNVSIFFTTIDTTRCKDKLVCILHVSLVWLLGVRLFLECSGCFRLKINLWVKNNRMFEHSKTYF